MGREESIMRQWLDVCVTEGDLLVAQQKLHKRPLLVAQMLEEWLNHYRRIAYVHTSIDLFCFSISFSNLIKIAHMMTLIIIGK